eukprot:COSAG02_NODE_2981_length_7624_cov_3.557475_2_plen_492_part_00
MLTCPCSCVWAGRNLAMFFRDVFAPGDTYAPDGNATGGPVLLPRLLNHSTVEAMQTFVNLTNDWCDTSVHSVVVCNFHQLLVGLWLCMTSSVHIKLCFYTALLSHCRCLTCKYGLGLFKEDQYEMSAKSQPQQLYMVGHAGTDFASSATLSSYNFHFDFGIALATNSATGLDCASDQPAAEAEGQHATVTACLVLDAVVRLYGHEGLFCESLDSSSHSYQGTNARAHIQDYDKKSAGGGATSQRKSAPLHTKVWPRDQLVPSPSTSRHEVTPVRVATPRKPSSQISLQLGSRKKANRGTAATCTWTSLWGSKCDVCKARSCTTCADSTCNTSTGGSCSCESCRHSHPWTHYGALSHAGVLPCGDFCAAAATSCPGITPSSPKNASGVWVWRGGSVSFFTDSKCKTAVEPHWNISGDCSTSLGPGADLYGHLPIPVGHVALGSNVTHATLIFGASDASCKDARLAHPQLGILPVASVGTCTQAGRSYFIARA